MRTSLTIGGTLAVAPSVALLPTSCDDDFGRDAGPNLDGGPTTTPEECDVGPCPTSCPNSTAEVGEPCDGTDLCDGTGGEPGELCDGADLGALTGDCTELGYAGSTITCDGHCPDFRNALPDPPTDKPSRRMQQRLEHAPKPLTAGLLVTR